MMLTNLAFVWRNLALGRKFNLVFLLVGFLALAAGTWMLDRSVSPAFEKLEQQAVQDQYARAGEVLATAVKFAEDSTTDYSVWDDSFNYMHDNNAHFVQVNAPVSTVANAGVNIVAYGRYDGQPRVVRYVDLATGKQDESRTRIIAEFVRDPAIRARVQRSEKVSGFIPIEGRILAIALVPIVRTDESGTPEGFMMMGKELAPGEVSKALQASTKIHLGGAPTAMVRTPDNWVISKEIKGIYGDTIGYLGFPMPRSISAQGRDALNVALLTTALILLLVLGSIYLVVRRVVVSRVQQIDSSVAVVADGARLTQLVHDPSEDELGSLNHNFNRMVAQLKNLQEQIEVQSFELGQSESNAGLLHNVRNSLNPVSVIVGQAVSEQPTVQMQLLERAISELGGDAINPQRREQLAAFLRAALDELRTSDSTRRGTLQTARAALAEAMEILSSSTSSDQPKDIPLEDVNLGEVLARNAEACRFVPWGVIDIRLPQGQASVRANRLLLSQVIANLMTNATESIIRADRKPGALTVTLTGANEGANGHLTLTIADDGAGFEPGMEAKLFERGESSKRNLSGGLGLHWSANTLRAMGGALRLESEGPGLGAKAILELKIAA